MLERTIYTLVHTCLFEIYVVLNDVNIFVNESSLGLNCY